MNPYGCTSQAAFKGVAVFSLPDHRSDHWVSGPWHLTSCIAIASVDCIGQEVLPHAVT